VPLAIGNFFIFNIFNTIFKSNTTNFLTNPPYMPTRQNYGDTTRLSRGSQPSANSITWCNIEKLYFFQMISDEDNFYIKIIVFDEIYHFVVLSFFI
jgi:hypothetical protein